MKKNLIFWQLAGLTFCAVLGTILHFLYDWTGSILVAPFSAVNESTWEHMKLLFFPALIFAFIQSVFFKGEFRQFWWIKLFGILMGLFTIPIIFYTYNGALGTSPDWFNVLIFFIALFFEFFWEYLLFKYDELNLKYGGIALCLLLFIAALFGFFTFYPPNLPIFISPV